jgi:hypothetical protein
VEPEGYRVYERPSSVSILSQKNPLYTLPLYFPKILLTIILQLTLDFPSGLFPSDFPTKMLYPLLYSHPAFYISAHVIILDLIFLIMCGEK